ncbi:MAG: aminomethyl transferase family protein [Actinobacteria bacterium]|nr:MAG: aminomethyl transferase family protein [Actinomycetota bacterium]
MEATKTPLQQLESELGAEFYEWEGAVWPTTFGDPVAEYLAVRQGVGLVDSSGLRKWEFRGPDALRAADRLVTQDCAAMVDGRVHYTPMCADNGTLLDDITVFRFSENRVMVVSGLDASEVHFREGVNGLDLEIVALSDARPSFQLQGPRSRDVLAKVSTVDLSTLSYFYFREGEVAGGDCIVSRTGYSGELGYELFCRPDDAVRIWQALMEAGEEHGIRPYGLEAADFLRVESGLIFVTFDYMPGESTPFELGLGWAVKFDKAAYRGRAALERLATEDPAHRIVGLTFAGGTPPEVGATVTRSGEEVGTVTAACRSAILDRVLALAVLRGDLARAISTSVEVGDLGAEVASIPFYDPEHRRPRA